MKLSRIVHRVTPFASVTWCKTPLSAPVDGSGEGLDRIAYSFVDPPSGGTIPASFAVIRWSTVAHTCPSCRSAARGTIKVNAEGGRAVLAAIQ